MGVPTSVVGYTPAMPRSEDHEVHKDMWWHWAGGTHSLFKHSLAVYYTVVCSSNFYVVLTSVVTMCLGDEISFTSL